MILGYYKYLIKYLLSHNKRRKQGRNRSLLNVRGALQSVQQIMMEYPFDCLPDDLIKLLLLSCDPLSQFTLSSCSKRFHRFQQWLEADWKEYCRSQWLTESKYNRSLEWFAQIRDIAEIPVKWKHLALMLYGNGLKKDYRCIKYPNSLSFGKYENDHVAPRSIMLRITSDEVLFGSISSGYGNGIRARDCDIRSTKNVSEKIIIFKGSFKNYANYKGKLCIKDNFSGTMTWPDGFSITDEFDKKENLMKGK